MALTTPLEEVKDTFYINQEGTKTFNKTACCMFIHGYQPKQKLEVYIYLTKAERLHSDEICTKWLKTLKSIGFNFEFLLKNDILVIGINNQDYETAWQTYLLFCLVRWIFYNLYSDLIPKTFEIREKYPNVTWFEAMQIGHGLPNKEGVPYSGGRSMYQGNPCYMIKLKPIKEFLKNKTFSSINKYFSSDFIPMDKPPVLEDFLNQEKHIKIAEEKAKEILEKFKKLTKEDPNYKGKHLYVLTESYGNLPAGSILRDTSIAEHRRLGTLYIKEVLFPLNFKGHSTPVTEPRNGYNFEGFHGYRKIEDK